MQKVCYTLALALFLVIGLEFERAAALAETAGQASGKADSSNSGQETLIRKNLPDPDVYVDPETELIYLTGTGRNVIPVLRSVDGVNFKLYKNIRPSEIDPKFNYCSIWAPDLTQESDGSFYLSFTADRSPKNEDCNTKKYRNMPPTIFSMRAKNDKFNFEQVQMIASNGGPNSKIGKGCFVKQSINTCENTIRIDSDVFFDSDTETEHFFYVWFWEGNNISSFPVNNPTNVTRHVVASEPYEEKIVEAPDVFKRGPYYYLIYSRGSFRHNYGLSYMFGKDLSKLVKGQSKIYPLINSVAKTGSVVCDFGEKNYTKGAVAENSGHSSTVKIDKDFYIYYHKAVFDYDSTGCHSLKFRHAYRSVLKFRDDGSIIPLQ